MSSIEQIIIHYQKDIEKINSRPERALKYEDRLLHCLNKLSKLPVTVHHLQITGVGKTVNSLRKIQGRNGVSEAAKALVSKWKNMVIEEDEAEEHSKESLKVLRGNDAKRIKCTPREDKREYSSSIDDNSSISYYPSQGNQKNYTYSPENLSHDLHIPDYSPSKNSHTPNGYSPGSPKSNGIQVLCYSPSKKLSKTEDKKSKDFSNYREGGKSEMGLKKDSKQEKPSSSHAYSEVRPRNHSHEEDKYKAYASSQGSSSSRHKSSTSSSSSSSTKSKHKREVGDDGIDSVSGTSFAQALGPILVKKGHATSSKKKIKTEPDEGIFSMTKSSSSSSEKRTSSVHSLSLSQKTLKPSQPSIKPLLDDVAGPSHLAPLDMDVVSTLSVPTPNYKPMPQLPLTSMERKQRIQAEEDALARIMSNKNKNARTKVYSGIKGGLSYVPSLYEICCNVLKLHIDALEYTGGIPYSLLKPVLDSATPSQLYQFEHFNPYMIGETEQLWQFHVNREFRGETREEMETWRDMYLRCVDEREEKYKSVTANIQESLKKSVPVRQTKLAYVDIAKPPRAVLRKQIKNGINRPDPEKMMGKDTPGAVRVRAAPRAFERPRVSPIFKPKVAPLMQKTLKSIKQTRFKR